MWCMFASKGVQFSRARAWLIQAWEGLLYGNTLHHTLNVSSTWPVWIFEGDC